MLGSSSRFEFVFTPQHASWINMVEILFSKIAAVHFCAVYACIPQKN
ncbi:MAG: hypothetical protein ACLQT6_16915 [Desulfomonilaceae bacterium]